MTYDFVSQDEHVVLGADLGDRGQLFSRKDLSRRVVRGVDDDDLGLIRKSGAVKGSPDQSQSSREPNT